MSRWRVQRLDGDAEHLHGREVLHERGRTVDVLEVTAPALVLGSTQRDDVLDRVAADAMRIDVVRRRTGGGAVHLAPGEHVWIDVTIPVDDPLWRDDVAHAFTWLGEVWVAALTDLGVESTTANDAAVCHSVLGRQICFAGLGYGEVSSPTGKVVGISQRRTRVGAWFQCALLRRWDTEPYRSLLAPALSRVVDDVDRELADIRVHALDAEPAAVVDAFLGHLPT